MTPLSNPIIRDAAAKMQTAMQSNDAEVIKQAWEEFGSAVADSIRQDYEVTNGDRSALLQRGYRLLTAEEKKFYQSWIDNARSNAPRQEFTDLLTTGMPETIIEDIYKNLVNDHPLLNAITFTNVSYMTKWLMSDRTVDSAVWGPINSEVAKKISSSFKVIEMQAELLRSNSQGYAGTGSCIPGCVHPYNPGRCNCLWPGKCYCFRRWQE